METHIDIGNAGVTASLRSRTKVEAALEAAFREAAGSEGPTIVFTQNDVVQNLKAWAAAPPKMRKCLVVPDERPALPSAALSSQDGTQNQANSSDE